MTILPEGALDEIYQTPYLFAPLEAEVSVYKFGADKFRVASSEYSDLLWRSTTMSVVRNIRQHLFCPFELVASLSAGPDPKDHERGPQHLSAGQRLDGP